MLPRERRLLLIAGRFATPKIFAAFIFPAAESHWTDGITLPVKGVAPVTLPALSKVRVNGSYIWPYSFPAESFGCVASYNSEKSPVIIFAVGAVVNSGLL